MITNGGPEKRCFDPIIYNYDPFGFFLFVRHLKYVSVTQMPRLGPLYERKGLPGKADALVLTQSRLVLQRVNMPKLSSSIHSFM